MGNFYAYPTVGLNATDRRILTTAPALVWFSPAM
jgi:hypothetical protein